MAKAKSKALELNECLYCMASGSSMCGGCGLASYCSRECQKAHWKDHKSRCILIEDRKASRLEPQETSTLTNECSICCEKIKSQTQCKLQCGHYFHAKCVEILRDMVIHVLYVEEIYRVSLKNYIF
jgi:hypothetical protein